MHDITVFKSSCSRSEIIPNYMFPVYNTHVYILIPSSDSKGSYYTAYTTQMVLTTQHILPRWLLLHNIYYPDGSYYTAYTTQMVLNTQHILPRWFLLHIIYYPDGC